MDGGRRIFFGIGGGVMLLVGLAGLARIAGAEAVTLRIDIRSQKDDEKVITRTNMLRIKQFILKGRKTGTMSAMYSDTPMHEGKTFNFSLLPDRGQESDPAKTDFNTLMIQVKEGGVIRYFNVDFRDENLICVMVAQPGEDVTVKGVREGVEKALREILAEAEEAAGAGK